MTDSYLSGDPSETDDPNQTYLGSYTRVAILARPWLGLLAIFLVVITAMLGFLWSISFGPGDAATSPMTFASILLVGFGYVQRRFGKPLPTFWKGAALMLCLLLLESLLTFFDPDRIPLIAEYINRQVVLALGLEVRGHLGPDTGLILLALTVTLLAGKKHCKISLYATVFSVFVTFESLVQLLNGISFFGGHMAWTTVICMVPLSLAALTLHARHPILRRVLLKGAAGRRLRIQILAALSIPSLTSILLRLSGDGVVLDSQLDAIIVSAISWVIVLYLLGNDRAHADLWQRERNMISRLSAQSVTDKLTGALNRRGLEDRLAESWSGYRRNGQLYAVAMLDLDHFKRINDTCGHLLGDRVLTRTGEILRDSLRLGDRIGRWGGEEFVLLLHVENLTEVNVLAERLRMAIAQIKLYDLLPDIADLAETADLKVTASFGISAFAQGDRGYSDAIDRADALLYRAKNAGRNRVEIDRDPFVAVEACNSAATVTATSGHRIALVANK
ncbi:GGDEF domain-containing protein [Loktanella agnita]|uniref:GGDEF domain-containing protein n=1 Tax=Loktanella agnita TaxID=287097 RepID=UPI00398722DA